MQITSHATVSILIQKGHDGYGVGYASLEFFCGVVEAHEIGPKKNDPYFALDTLLYLLRLHEIEEVLFTFLGEADLQKEVLDYLALQQRYRVVLSSERMSVPQQEELFCSVFGLRTLLSPHEHLDMQEKPLCAESLSLLLWHVQKRDQNRALTLRVPLHERGAKRLYLGNNALEQLGVVGSDPLEFTLLALLDRCETPMGSRALRRRLLTPIVDAKELHRRYDAIAKAGIYLLFLHEALEGIGDIERIAHKIAARDFGLHEIALLAQWIVHAKTLLGVVKRYRIEKISMKESQLDTLLLFLQNAPKMQEELCLKRLHDEHYETLVLLTEFVATIDMACAGAMAAQKWGHTRPTIIQTQESENFLQIMELRHPLLEMQVARDGYVTNDIVMGERKYMDLPHPNTAMLDVRVHDGHMVRGVLLYGVNSSGKSSLAKSIGLAVLMAQSGFYVSATAMKFSLFDSLFTRIVSKDSILQGLSTFGLEMRELQNIFCRATPKSLVLGDEISHGTETISGVSIVASALMKLSSMRLLFIFATHLHQLTALAEVQKLKSVVSMHLGVMYDEVLDRLVYDRVLRSGSGSTLYGLEFVKSLHMDSEFLQNASKIRTRISGESSFASFERIKKEQPKVEQKPQKIDFDDWE